MWGRLYVEEQEVCRDQRQPQLLGISRRASRDSKLIVDHN